MKRIISILAFVVGTLSGFAQQDIPEQLVSAFKTGNAEEIGVYMNANVEFVLFDSEKVMTKQQVKLVLQDFFQKNKPSDFRILHKAVQEDSGFMIALLESKTTKETYRVSMLLKKNEQKMLINQLRIEKPNE